MRRALVAVVLAALVLATAAGATRVRWHGGLDSYASGNSVGLAMAVDAPFSVGMGVLRASGGRVRIESVRLHGASPGLELVGSLVHDTGRGMVGSDRAYPPTFPRSMPKRPAAGAVIPAHTGLVFVVGMRATWPGDFRAYGVDVLYRQRWHGIEIRRRAHLGVEVNVCAAHTRAEYPDCAVPEPAPG